MKLAKPKFNILIDNWFLLGILLVIILAYFYPNIGAKDGYFKPNYTVPVAIVGIFLISGLNTPFTCIIKALKESKLILFSLFISFILFPLFGTSFGLLIITLKIPSIFAKGFVIATCMPPPVSAGVILTNHFNGDESTSLVISVVGNLISTIISPLLIIFINSEDTVFPFLKLVNSLTSLVLCILVPTIVGQIANIFISKEILNKSKPILNVIGKVLLLYIICIKVCPIFLPDNDTAFTLKSIIVICISIISIQTVVAIIIVLADMQLRIIDHPKKRISVVLSCSLKSLTTGVTIISIMHANDPNAKYLIFPLLMFEPLQIAFSTIIGSYLITPDESNINTIV